MNVSDSRAGDGAADQARRKVCLANELVLHSRQFSSDALPKHNGTTPVQQYPALGVPEHGAGEHRAFHVLAEADKSFPI
jgi:hypothetical protein